LQRDAPLPAPARDNLLVFTASAGVIGLLTLLFSWATQGAAAYDRIRGSIGVAGCVVLSLLFAASAWFAHRRGEGLAGLATAAALATVAASAALAAWSIQAEPASFSLVATIAPWSVVAAHVGLTAQAAVRGQRVWNERTALVVVQLLLALAGSYIALRLAL
jgi:hypothetical protein